MRRNHYEIQHVLTAILLAGVFFLNCEANVQAYTQVRNDSADSVQLYYFTSQSCPPCRQVEPEMIRLYEAGYPVFKVDAHKKPEWSEHFGVQRTPTTILVSGKEVVARHSGLIDARTVKDWFDSIGYAPQVAQGSSRQRSSRQRSSRQGKSKRSDSSSSPNRSIASKSLPGRAVEIPVSTRGLSDTLHRGTDRPANDYESVALRATVRLKVEDEEGTSFATGTVIHSYEGESLVLTCGHVFRESNGDGKIICEYGFADKEMRIAYGELIYFDADERDIGLVAIGPNVDIEPVPVARKGFDVRPGLDVFSIGCDQGDSPTIRHSRIKNLAKYSGVQKYDIFGRPVVGRSGGGLFTNKGELVGVCNAAVVDFDEGVYVGLETVYWQVSKVNLNHLFDGRRLPNRNAIAQNRNNIRSTAPIQAVSPRSSEAKSVVEQFPDDAIVRADAIPPATLVRADNPTDRGGIDGRATLVSSTEADQHPLAASNANSQQNQLPSKQSEGELIVIYRENDSAPMTTWRIQNPKSNLLRELKSHPADASSIRKQPNADAAGMAERKHAADRMAALRYQMPNVQPSEKRSRFRAQSPR